MKEGSAKPYNPYMILAIAIILPGVGHVLNGNPQRGLTFVFFIIVLAWTTSKIAPPQAMMDELRKRPDLFARVEPIGVPALSDWQQKDNCRNPNDCPTPAIEPPHKSPWRSS